MKLLSLVVILTSLKWNCEAAARLIAKLIRKPQLPTKEAKSISFFKPLVKQVFRSRYSKDRSNCKFLTRQPSTVAAYIYKTLHKSTKFLDH